MRLALIVDRRTHVHVTMVGVLVGKVLLGVTLTRAR